jgi:hypothetical protein
MVVAMSLAVLGPWVLELLGLASPTIVFEPGLRVVSAAIEPTAFSSGLGLSVFAALLVTMTALMMLRRAGLEDAAQRRLHFQAWRLEQLVPVGH